MKPLGLYIHIPFCVQKCRYCDFLSFRDEDQDLHFLYTEALIKEIQFAGKRQAGAVVDSIFIGGGTPSLLEGENIVKMMNEIRWNFQVDVDAEITIEANPATLSPDKLKTYLDTGINRLSLGVQSLDDKLLSILGRVHRAEEALETYEEARSQGFQNINIDLMFSIPGQTMDIWLRDLTSMINRNPEHISFYSLQLEGGTPFYSLYKEGKLSLADDETERLMYWEAVSALKRGGYSHYEISNGAKPGRECRHNMKYWSMGDYLGMGLGAHSYVDGWRFSNHRDMKTYLEQGKADTFVASSHKNSPQDEMGEFIFTGMRRMEGISLHEFHQRFGVKITDLHGKEIGEHLTSGLLKTDEEKGRLSFTNKGVDRSNWVLSDFV